MRNSSEKLSLQLFEREEEGTLVARDYRDGSLWRVRWDASGLRERVATTAMQTNGIWIAPGLFDLQVNGYGGVDFQRPCGLAELRHAADALRKDGCERALLTLITCPWDELLAKIERLRTIIRGDPRLSAAFPGWHVEGPFLLDEPGFRGAHNPRWMRDPSAGDILRLKEVVGGDPLLLTMAPERFSALEAINQCVECGFVVSFGHTNASAGELAAAAKAGGRAFTHLGNGCPQMLDRHDNILWRVFDEETLIAGVIPDGRHISPPLFRLLHRALGKSRVYWTTDAMAAAGAPCGRYSLGEFEAEIGDDRVVRNPETGGFAGSALEPLEGIRNGAAMLDWPWQKVWDFLSLNPARLMNLPGVLDVGSPAGFCLLREG